MLNLKSIEVEGQVLSILLEPEKTFISLTDMAKCFKKLQNPIGDWIRSYETCMFLYSWEVENNLNFNKEEALKIINSNDRLKMSVKKWTKDFYGIGLYSKTGKYGSGTWAHKDISVYFMLYLNPLFTVKLITKLNNNFGFNELTDMFRNTIIIKKNCESYIYLMKNNNTNFYKIGKANCVEYREKTLQAQEPDIITIISKQYESELESYKIEKELHNKYDDVRLRGEWFDLDEEMVIEVTNFLK